MDPPADGVAADRPLWAGPAPQQAIYLLPFAETMVAGRVWIESLVLHLGVERVELHLDGRPVRTVRGPGFGAWVHLGKLPLPHTLEAVAFDAGGVELGRDRLAVNHGLARFAARISAPQRIASSGLYDVVVDVTVPVGRQVERLELFWGQELLAVLARPPFHYRAHLAVPEAGGGFLRALATLDDGRVAEDARMAGQAGFRERLAVDLVEMYAVVEDRDGRPVTDLPRESFALSEDGRDQTLRSFVAGAEMPLHLGLVIDTSFSMEEAMPLVKTAAQRFLREVVRPGDRGFLVAFRDSPFLAQPMTDDLDRLSAAIRRFTADGNTAIWDAMIFSLMQLTGTPGRKALVLLTDGGDMASRFDVSAATELARRIGVPVYVIRMEGTNQLPARRHRAALRRIAHLTGAEAFLVEEAGDLSEIYGTIAEELHSQYVLGFQSDQPPSESGWRTLRLEVDRPDLRVRSTSGYYASP